MGSSTATETFVVAVLVLSGCYRANDQVSDAPPDPDDGADPDGPPGEVCAGTGLQPRVVAEVV